MSITNSIQFTLNIKEEFLTFSENSVSKSTFRGIESLIYHGTLAPPPPEYCPKCGSKNECFSVIRHGFKTSSVILPRISNFNTVLKLKKQRFFCKHCSSTFIAESNTVEKNCFISNNTRISCVLDMKKKISIFDIAQRHSISHGTVNQHLHKLNSEFVAKKDFLPPHISMDEFKSVKSTNAAMSFVFLDCESGKVIDIVPDRRLDKLIQYFNSYTLEARCLVKTVCIDMYTPYIALIKKCFPNAKIITDRFHVIQLISRSLNKTRIQLMNQDKRNYNKLKRYWKLILKNRDDLNDNEFRHYTCFSIQMREIDIVNYLLELDSSFKDSYWFYQDLLSAFKRKDSTAFFNTLTSAPSSISRYLKTSKETLLKHQEYVTNALSHSYNNGRIEGTNNLIKVIKRIAFGYRNFTTFRVRILLITNTMIRLNT